MSVASALSGRARLLLVGLAFCAATAAKAHGVAEGDQAFIEMTSGTRIGPFFYLGAKHMVTGIDHLLFLLGVIFYLYRLRQVATYVTLFALGHSTTLILGVLLHTQVNAYLVDAVIGLSVVYKALDNLGAFKRLGINPKLAVLFFGLFHGLGLATKIQGLGLSGEGVVANLVAFNLGVEAGQLVALTAMLIVIGYWRRTRSFERYAFAANVALMMAGFVLFGLQMAGYFTQGSAA
ncbi:hypothetical protein WSK_0158 [Novosphingobium sp. Rr 2-17]|uniref:HupE/UreJ family protein n=1 Tax=Novosphingobium sp. Rr 2-17 TaxID=555793 RepID=UPI0002697E37|nr:HupE/UreJ family protein [Novosphingobium sp. Rr 2-17]EIZ81213.1 hypothetical protein WSK_0158 [Novosphingobium sp. Rr 2-17]